MARAQDDVLAVQASLGPLVALLGSELALIDEAAPGRKPLTTRAFTRWYLEAVQRLEAHCASRNRQQPMTREEVELMCRCALSSRTLQEAMGVCSRFGEMLYPRAGRCEVVARGAVASFRMDSLRFQPTTASSLVDITGLFAFRQLFQWLAGVELQLLQVNIGPVQRDDVLPFLKLFGAPVLSGGDCCTMDFPAGVLQLPVVRTSGEFSDFFEVFPCGVFEDTRRSLPEQVLSLIAASLRQGAGVPTQAQLATAMGLTLSTFRRRLAQSETSFRQLRESCLRDAACHRLERGDTSIKELAALLGFSDPGAFRRAFRQWTGMSPTAWAQRSIGLRAEHGQYFG